MKIDFYFSVRSPYSYLISPRIIMLRDEYGVDVNFKLVYPLAIREPEFFEGKNFFTYFWWKMIDMKLKARRLGLPFSLPCLLYTSPSPRDVEESRMPSSA